MQLLIEKNGETHLTCAGVLMAASDVGYGIDAPTEGAARGRAAVTELLYEARAAGFTQSDIAATVFASGSFERAEAFAHTVAKFITADAMSLALARAGWGQ